MIAIRWIYSDCRGRHTHTHVPFQFVFSPPTAHPNQILEHSKSMRIITDFVLPRPGLHTVWQPKKFGFLSFFLLLVPFLLFFNFCLDLAVFLKKYYSSLSCFDRIHVVEVDEH